MLRSITAPGVLQFPLSLVKTFDSTFGPFQRDLARWNKRIRDEIRLASSIQQKNEAQENAKHRELSMKFMEFMTLDRRQSRERRLQEAKSVKMRFLNMLSDYPFQEAWKKARNARLQGTAMWITKHELFRKWLSRGVCWCSGRRKSLLSSLHDDKRSRSEFVISKHYAFVPLP
jgi:hypothetical protein